MAVPQSHRGRVRGYGHVVQRGGYVWQLWRGAAQELWLGEVPAVLAGMGAIGPAYNTSRGMPRHVGRLSCMQDACSGRRDALQGGDLSSCPGNGSVAPMASGRAIKAARVAPDAWQRVVQWAPSVSRGSWWPPGWSWGPLGRLGTCVLRPGVGDRSQVHLLPLGACRAVVTVSTKWHPRDGGCHEWCVSHCGVSMPQLPTIASSGRNLWSAVHRVCKNRPTRDCTTCNQQIGFRQPSAQLRRD